MSRRLAAAERMLERLERDARRIAEDAAAALRALREVQPSPDEPIVLDAAQAAAMTGLSTQAVYRLARVGVLPCVRVGERGVRFYRPGIEKWLADGGARPESCRFSASPSAQATATEES